MKDNYVNTDIIQRAKYGDIKALEEVLKKTEKDIYSFLYFISHGENELSDVVQDVLLKIARKIKTLKDLKTYKYWVNRIAIRGYYDYLRKIKKEKMKAEICEITDEFDCCDKKREPIEECIGCELTEIIKKSLCKLKEPYKAALLLKEFEEMSYEDIAKLTKTNIGTVKSRIARARGQLKEYIKPYMEIK